VKICVVALGKIGLPLAVQFASKGHEVVGVDVNPDTVASVNAGTEPFPGEDHLQEKLSELVPAGRLRATTDYADAVPGADAVVLVVPLFVDEAGTPDFGWMDGATRSLAEHLTPGTLVSYETTLPVGTTRNRWKPMLEEVSGLTEGTDFHLVFSPERVLTGRVFADLRKYPKLIGGLSEAGAAKAREFYEAVLDFDERPDLARPNGVWDLGSAEASELAKLAETTYRDVNIGLANQFARFAATTGIDVFSVIEASNSQPFSHIHRPGIAVGGHCIPVYPRLYLSTDPDADIVRTARNYNATMPAYVVDRVQGVIGDLAGQRSRGHEDRRHGLGFGQRAQGAQGRRPVHARHHDVEQQQIRDEFSHAQQRLVAGGSDLDRKAANRFERQLGDRADVDLVLDVQNPLQASTHHRSPSRSSSRLRLPTEHAGPVQHAPPTASTRARSAPAVRWRYAT